MKTLLIAISLAFAISACSKGDTQATVSDGRGEADIKLVILKDGTRCAALIGYQKGAIHCNWTPAQE